MYIELHVPMLTWKCRNGIPAVLASAIFLLLPQLHQSLVDFIDITRRDYKVIY